jgi:tRNA (cytidine/uridine-2'-O-)-methyltransferase
MDDKTLLRAGLDYWKDVDCTRWPDWETLRAAAGPQARYWYFTTKTKRRHWDAAFANGDYLVFGRETKGLPEALLAENEPHCVTIPQVAGRSLNLATSVGIGVYEALRQIEFTAPGV